jgi:hypothetical protein
MAGKRAPGFVAACLLLGAGVCGCQNKPEPPPLVPVKGKVIKAGDEALPWILVEFHPQDAAGGTPYRGGTDKDGRFTLSCPAGPYRVTLGALPSGSPAAGPGAKTAPGQAPAIPAPYRFPGRTPLKVTVPADGTSDVVLEVR